MFERGPWLLSAVLTLLVASTSSGEPAYVGVKACKKCHIQQFKAWSETKMAKAFELLRPNVKAAEKTKAKLDPAKDYTSDAKCLGCHTVGYGKAGGYTVGADVEVLAGVGCEMCHGPGGDYLADDRHSLKNKEFKSADLAQFGFVPKPTAAQCHACHNDKSPFFQPFDFEKRKKEGTHKHFELKYKH